MIIECQRPIGEGIRFRNDFVIQQCRFRKILSPETGTVSWTCPGDLLQRDRETWNIAKRRQSAKHHSSCEIFARTQSAAGFPRLPNRTTNSNFSLSYPFLKLHFSATLLNQLQRLQQVLRNRQKFIRITRQRLLFKCFFSNSNFYNHSIVTF